MDQANMQPDMNPINKDFPLYDGSKAARKVRLITGQVNSKRIWLRKPKKQPRGWAPAGSKKNKNINKYKPKPYKKLAKEKRTARLMMALGHIIHGQGYGHGGDNTWRCWCDYAETYYHDDYDHGDDEWLGIYYL